jgi:predicted lipoprotein with Yx(FWY)xxD motif
MANVGPPAPSAFTLSLARGPQGIFEVGPNGHTLYYTSSDKGTTSSCTGGCALTWPALTSSAPPTGGPAIDMTQVGTANGQVPNQVTYFGHLLYYFSGDNNPGDTNGVGRPGWFLLGPRGNQMVPR